MMTPRERVLTAVRHKPTDRTPSDYHANPVVTERLIAKLGVANQEELLQALHVDMRPVGWFNYYQPESGPDAEGYKRNMWGVRYRDQDPGDGRPQRIYPFTEDTTVDDVREHPWPDPARLDYSALRAACARYHDTYATYGAPWSPFFHEVGWTVGQENFYMWLISKPDVIRAIIDRIVDYEVEVTRRFLEACDGLLDIAYFGNDFGTQRCLFVSPDMWEQYFRAPLKRFYDVARAHGCLVMQHSCGSVRQIIPQLIASGVDILDPIQVRAEGMSLAELTREFGGRLALHGAVDTQQTLPGGSTDDVRAEVRAYRALTRARGGYILCGSQNFIEDIPLDNILAMYDENLRG